MMNYVGLDVSQKTTTLCIVDGEGHRQWRGECVTSPEQIVRAVLQHAGAGARIGIETGPMTPWLVHELRSRGLDVICLDALRAIALLPARRENVAAFSHSSPRKAWYARRSR